MKGAIDIQVVTVFAVNVFAIFSTKIKVGIVDVCSKLNFFPNPLEVAMNVYAHMLLMFY